MKGKPVKHFSRFLFFVALSLATLSLTLGQTPIPSNYDSLAQAIVREALGSNHSYALLNDLVIKVGNRLSGSPANAKAVAWARNTMERLGFENVRLEPVMVPKWVRGNVEEAFILHPDGKQERLNIVALGGSIATPNKGITAGVVEVKSFEELRSLGAAAKGKVVFFNRPMDRTLMTTFAGYSGAVNQRGRGAVEAAYAGGVAAIVRSMTTRLDDVPHTGGMGYADTVAKVPTAAVSTVGAERLSALLKEGKNIRLQIKLSAQSFPDVESANVLGELRGTEKPEEVVVIGGHLDSWDKGQGAHDDGAGCVHAIEALRILKSLGLQPKRTIRAVMFANEENGLRGGTAYAAQERLGEKHIAAIESDAGGFAPRAFGVSEPAYEKVLAWASALRFVGIDRVQRGGGGADIGPLMRKGVPGLGLIPEGHRYFDYHHSDSDTIDKVNERELALGSAAMALMAWLVAQEGL
ncbi:MAG: M20/M25/M40 family metallo-hydrolase [Ignavibacteriales bacterium]|nr:M20/M25/M40 family metallo-hydrolase [Ignavibacteriales bacterium]